VAEDTGKITKIIYFIESPFNRRDCERLGVEVFIKNGFEVYVWDFTPFLHPEVHRKVEVPDPITFVGYRQFLTKSEVLSAIQKEPIDESFEFPLNGLLYFSGIFKTYF
jgi:hypothetical protein